MWLPIMAATLHPLAAVPWNDVNLLIVTDVHSWVAGHRHPDHEPVLDADYGHVLSLHERLSAAAAAEGRDLFLVQNGDLNDGTGFSRKPPVALTPLLQRVPFDALTTGNHELYENENIDYLARPAGFIDSWRGSYLTANTLNATTGEHLGARHKLLVGRASGVRVLAFGFLYDMINHDDHVHVVPVEVVVKQAWFLAALNATHEYDALLFLAHMGHGDPLVDLLLAAVRAVVGTALPILFVTGHTHVRAYRTLDTHAAAYEAGHYLDTVGFASFALSPPQSMSPSPSTSSFAHVNIDANRASMAAAVGLDDPAALLTASGAALQSEIARVASDLGLNRILGCSPRTYETYSALTAPSSLWRLYVSEVTLQAALGGNASRIVVQSTGSLRYDLYAGPVTSDDMWTMCPFADRYWRVAPAVGGDDMRVVLSALHARAPDAADGLSGGRLPRYAATSTPASGETYELWTVDFNLPTVVGAYEAQTGNRASPVRMLEGETTTDVWIRWVQEAWPCNASNGATDNANRQQRLDLPLLLLLVALVLVFLLVLLLLVYRRRRGRRLCCIRNAAPIRNVRLMGSATPTAMTKETEVTMPDLPVNSSPVV